MCGTFLKATSISISKEKLSKIIYKIACDLQSFTKIFRLTLVFMQSGTLREKFNFCFSRVFVSISKFFNLAGRLGAGLLLFYEVFITF